MSGDGGEAAVWLLSGSRGFRVANKGRQERKKTRSPKVEYSYTN